MQFMFQNVVSLCKNLMMGRFNTMSMVRKPWIADGLVGLIEVTDAIETMFSKEKICH